MRDEDGELATTLVLPHPDDYPVETPHGTSLEIGVVGDREGTALVLMHATDYFGGAFHMRRFDCR